MIKVEQVGDSAGKSHKKKSLWSWKKISLAMRD